MDDDDPALLSHTTASYKALQEGVSAICKSVTPLWHKYTAAASFRKVDHVLGREAKQADNLKKQQEMFHRLLNRVCLSHEGLVPEEEVISCRLEILDCIKSPSDEDDWPQLTRDKLVFLQDLLLAGCICEDEYHDAKRPLILRLAEQGADIHTQDVVLSAGSSQTKIFRQTNDPSGISQATRIVNPPHQRMDHRINDKNSPIKQVIEAMTRLKTKSGEKYVSRVPHALDFLRPKDCPIRDPPSPSRPLERPSGIDTAIPLLRPWDTSRENRDNNEPPGASTNGFAWPKPIDTISATSTSNLASPLLVPPLKIQNQNKSGNRVKNIFTEFVQKLQGDSKKTPQTPRSCFSSDDSDSDSPKEKASQKAWVFDLLRPPRKLGVDESRNQEICMSKSNANLLENRILKERANGQGPNMVKLKKKIHTDGAPTDFFIDKVLGENIKEQLSRIRAEVNKTSSGQIFTNEQIDAIATRLPVDKSELEYFFPRAWCDRYGDVVLDVVRKEFKAHVGEMESLRQAAKEKRSKVKKRDENDENAAAAGRGSMSLQQKSPSSDRETINKCFTTVGEDNVLNESPCSKFTTNYQEEQHEHRSMKRVHELRKESGLEDDLQGKLGEEIQKMPATTTIPRKTRARAAGAVVDSSCQTSVG